MLNLVLDFVACLRAGDLRVSTLEVLDCLRQLELADALNEAEFRTVLRSNLVKSRREQRDFDRLYELFFHGRATDEGEDEQARRALMTEMAAGLRQQDSADERIEAVLDFLGGNPLRFLELLQKVRGETEAPSILRFSLGPLAGRLEVMVALNTVRDLALKSPAGREPGIARRINFRLERAYALLTNEPGPENDVTRITREHTEHHKGLGSRAFSSLSEQELREMRSVVEALARKLKDIIGRRLAATHRGELDIKRTLRLAQRYQGVPLDIRYHHPPRRKARLVTLCDVSSSVWSAARFMLGVLYALQDCFSEVRSFIFVNRVAEVTQVFKENETNAAIGKVLRETDIEYNAATDYGGALVSFRDQHLERLNKKTTLIIIGDARSNYLPPREDILALMRERCRRVIWLNPEPQQLWYSADSEMRAYEPYCHELRACRNLNQLMEFVEELVL